MNNFDSIIITFEFCCVIVLLGYDSETLLLHINRFNMSEGGVPLSRPIQMTAKKNIENIDEAVRQKVIQPCSLD